MPQRLQVRNAADDSRLGAYQDLAITIKDVPAPALVFTRRELLEGSAGIITRLENKVSGLPDYEAQLRQTITEKQAVLSDVENQAGKPFKYDDKLARARATCAELDEKLKASIDPPRPSPAAEAPPIGGGGGGGPGACTTAQAAGRQLPLSSEEHTPDTHSPAAARGKRTRARIHTRRGFRALKQGRGRRKGGRSSGTPDTRRTNW